MISIKKSGLRALLITLFTMLIISSLVVLVKAKNSSGEVKEVEKTTVLAQQWFEYIGPSHTSSNYSSEVLKSENYTPMDEADPTCLTGNTLCAVKVTPDPSNSDQPDQGSLTLLSNEILKIVPQDDQIVRFLN